MLCIGRLGAVKFPDDAVRVLGGVTALGHDVRLLFAGDGEMRASLTELAASLGVADRLVFGGNQDRHALAQLNAHAALAQAAARMLDDPVRARRLGAKAREQALAMLDPVALDRHERDTYDRLFAGLPPAPGI